MLVLPSRASAHLSAAHTFAEKESPTSARLFADVPLGGFTGTAVRVLRDRKADLPESANARIKAIRQVYAWALEAQVRGVTFNPARDVAYLKGSRTGFMRLSSSMVWWPAF
jgi:hypothetical protein